jgi:CBS domain containing-hemolysin-like protein
MCTPVVIAEDTEDAGKVVERMRAHGIRRVPVVNHRGGVVGVVTLDDLLKSVVAEASMLVETMAKGYDREQRVRR